MTYRNDHDAALARIDSLEQELEAMKAAPEPAAPKPVVPAKRYAWKIGIVATTAAIGMATAWVAPRAHTRSRLTHSGSAPAVAVPIFASADSLQPCVVQVLAARGDGFDARTTDPRHGGRSVAAIEAVGASCRHELAQLVRDDVALTSEQRVAFRQWLAAEDALAGDLSRIVVYYSNDPYQLDNYASATQLWHEYDIDRAARDAAMPAVVQTLQQPNS